MIKLTCHSCGGKLEITDDIERFTCGHCGNEWIVNRAGGIVSLKAIEENLSKVQEHTKETAGHSKILADQVKLKAIKERITTLSAEANKINKNPHKKNDKKNDFLSKTGWLAFVFFSIMLLNLIGPGRSNNYVLIITGLSFLLFIIFVFLYIITSIFTKGTCSDEQQKQININKIKELENEINDLKNKTKAIEESFLK